MTWRQLLDWANDPARTNTELRDAIVALEASGINVARGGSYRTRLTSAIAAQPDLTAAAPWTPAGYIPPTPTPAPAPAPAPATTAPAPATPPPAAPPASATVPPAATTPRRTNMRVVLATLGVIAILIAGVWLLNTQPWDNGPNGPTLVATATATPLATAVPTQVPTAAPTTASPTASPTVVPTASETPAPTATAPALTADDIARAVADALAKALANQPSAPSATATASPTTAPAPDTSGDPSFEELAGFNPVRDYQQSCEPERTEGCTWDVGAEGSKSDMLGRHVVQVGIVKGVRIDWPEGNLRADPSSNGRCSLVILTPDSWFENLHVVDANVSTYNVDARDWMGWMKTLAVQAAYEQESDYGCPHKEYEQIPQWTSSINSPPCGTPGFPDCANAPAPTTTPQTSDPTSETPDSANCETVNCKERRATAADCGGKCDFKTDEAVYGNIITMSDGTVYRDCWIEKVTMDGTVVDGVVNPWKTEVEGKRKCG